ncbi:hypothetical protein [Brevundimonas aurantiaca]|uniref:hypothetical protein n=1 Tax=Brevundimonas aurantiaca TaxID=74316 RepID=UPI00174D0A13|nr:hypothetical protein [Brevundimonas aurantiaca]
MTRIALFVAVALAGCSAPDRTAEIAADPDAAARVVAACDAGRTETECDAARRGLAEARRDARMGAYEQAF